MVGWDLQNLCLDAECLEETRWGGKGDGGSAEAADGVAARADGGGDDWPERVEDPKDEGQEEDVCVGEAGFG